MTKGRQAVILAGGKGTRLAERLNGRPKPLVDIDGRPLLARQFGHLRAAKVTEILVLANHGITDVEVFCRDPTFEDLKITVIDDGEPRGTAGALLNVFDVLAERFFVIYGDTLFDIDLDRFWSEHALSGAQASLLLHPNDHPFDSDLVEVDGQLRIIGFHAPPHGQEEWLPNLVNAAMYIIERGAIAFWRDYPRPSDIARDLFPAMLRRTTRMQGYLSFEYIKDIGTPKRLDLAVQHLRMGVVERARKSSPQALVFMDRDGTINELRGHLAKAEDFTLIEGAAQAIRNLNGSEYRVVVATNQPVLARGECDFAELRRIHAKLETQIGKFGAFVDRIEVCPHHPDRGFVGEAAGLKVTCKCRKPGTLMVERACEALNADRARSWFIGDSTADMLCAARAGLRSVLVATGEGGLDGKYAVRPDYTADDLSSAVSFILNVHGRLLELIGGTVASISHGHLVLIGGLAKTGKSSISSALREALRARGVASEILSLDGYLLDRNKREPGVLGRYDLLSAIDMLAPWLAGSSPLDVESPHYDRRLRKRMNTTIPLMLPPSGVLIVEGVPALLCDIVTDRPIHRIFVQGSESTRKSRVISDLIHRDESLMSAQHAYEAREEDESRIILATLKQADVVINCDSAYTF